MGKRVARSKAQVQAVVVLGGFFLILLLGAVIFRSAAKQEPADMFYQALRNLKKAGDYGIIIREHAPGYQLLFQGNVNNGTILSGTLPDHQLEVLYKGNGLYVRKAGAAEWEEAKELQSLAGFLISPLTLLQSQTDNFQHASVGQDIVLDGSFYRTVYLDISAETRLLKVMFPQIDTDAIQKVSLGAALRDEDFSVKQVRVLVEFRDTGSLERAFYLE